MLYLLSPDQKVLSARLKVNHHDFPHFTKCLGVNVFHLYSMMTLSYHLSKVISVGNDNQVSMK